MEPEKSKAIPILQEVNNIEQLVNEQNSILQDVLKKISDELKVNRSRSTIVQSTQCIQEDFKESGICDSLLTKLIKENFKSFYRKWRLPKYQPNKVARGNKKTKFHNR